MNKNPRVLRPAFDVPDSGLAILDCDEVLLEYYVAFARHLRRRHGLDVSEQGPEIYDMLAWSTLPDRASLAREVVSFSESSEGGFREMPVIPGAQEALSSMRNAGCRLVVISKCSSSPRTVRMREENLVSAFGADAFDEIVCLGLDQSKSEDLRRFGPSLFIDDLPANVTDGQAAGHRSVLMNRSHNRSFVTSGADGMEVLDGWDGFRIAHDSPRPESF